MKETAVEIWFHIIITKTKAIFTSTSKDNTNQSHMWYKTLE